MFYCVYVFTDLNSIWSLQYVAKPAITNSGIYTYTGGSIGPTIASSSYYTVTGNKNTTVSKTAYTYRVALNNKTTYKWTDGTTDDLTGTYYIKYATYTLNVATTGNPGVGHVEVTYMNEYNESKTYVSSSLTTTALHVKQGSTVSYKVFVTENSYNGDPAYDYTGMVQAAEDGVTYAYGLAPFVGMGVGTFEAKSGTFAAKNGTMTVSTGVKRSGPSERVFSYSVSLP